MVDYSYRITFPHIGTLVTVSKINRVYIELIIRVNYIEIILETHFYIRCSSRTALAGLGVVHQSLTNEIHPSVLLLKPLKRVLLKPTWTETYVSETGRARSARLCGRNCF